MRREMGKPNHPGRFIREHVIPSKVSVTDAAKRLGVGRPALSNLLNGKSSLSDDMAFRLEKAFGEDHQKLLDLQAEFNRHERRGKARSLAVHAYVPPFLTIEARQIEDWAETIDARHRLAVLLRRLIHSTGRSLRRVDFPGYDNAERKGWDGLIDARAATPWIPEGESCWEFGTNQNPRRKAEDDYGNRTRSVSKEERDECTFVFVTPRNWPGKTKWAKRKLGAGDWKAVRAYDASDLEQWLEESIPAQIWLAERLQVPADGFETLDHFWKRWSEASNPSITPAIFEPSITAFRDKFSKWLKKRSERPFVVTADSREEAIAFLACLFRDNVIEKQSGDLAVVFDSAQTLRRLASSPVSFIPIVFSKAVERELAPICRRLHCLIVRPRNAVNSTPDIALDPLDDDGFVKALDEMGFGQDEARRLTRESGRSPTILRRRLSQIDAIRTPQWAEDEGIAKSLIPMALIGSWRADSNADREVLERLSGQPYREIESSIRCLLQSDDRPVWSVGQHRGATSQIDALFAIGWQITNEDLTKFFEVAENVLSESDPALDLPEEERWTAALHGKVRAHSKPMRNGICDNLVILAIHGNNLFRDQLGMDVEVRVSSFISRLLTPLTLDKLLSHGDHLPRYAEASPDGFLDLIENDLRCASPVVPGLLKPADGGLFGGCPRTGLLWALECLAWKNLGRTNLILAELSRTVINDNWANTPINSLQAIYRSWMPQTAASLEERIKALGALTIRFPDIGWRICVEQLSNGPQMGMSSYRPRWRGDASGAGRPLTTGEPFEFLRKVLDLVLAWPDHDENTFGDLVDGLWRMPEKDRDKVWNLIDGWADSQADDRAKAVLAERIRKFVFKPAGAKTSWNKVGQERARSAYSKLRPEDPVVCHAWLFADTWIHYSIDDDEEGDFDYDKHADRIDSRRSEAMGEIWATRGFDGVTALLSDGGIADLVGRHMVSTLIDTRQRASFLKQCLSITSHRESEIDGCIRGFLGAIEPEARRGTLDLFANDLDTDQIVRLIRCAPFGQDTWRHLDQYDGEVRRRYWSEVLPDWARHSESELIEIIDRLLEAKRPRAAFRAVQWNSSKIETSRLKRLLFAVATMNQEPEGHYLPEAYQISEALSALDGRSDVSREEMAQLEYWYIKALDRGEHGIPNLEWMVAESPILFVQILARCFRRRDGGQDPPEWRIEDSDHGQTRANSAFRVLRRINRLPGTRPDGGINTENLFAWVTEVRRLCSEHGRVEIGDEYIGQLLSGAPGESSGSWPCLSVCEVMQRISAKHIGLGFIVGIRNRRGVTTRGINDGGSQERTLAAKYREWAKQCAFDYPYVGRVLEGIAAAYDAEARSHDSDVKIRNRLG